MLNEKLSQWLADKKNHRLLILSILVAIGCIAFIWVIKYSFDHVQSFRELFAAPGTDIQGGGDPLSEQEVLDHSMLTAKVSMWIFAFISVLQIIAFFTGALVISSIRHSSDDVALKLKNLENAEIFFDIPLYFGLFGTVSAFLVMTFSPQSSRLIAYSSTLIGILFSLVLRLTLQYPLRRTLMRLDYEQNRSQHK